METKISVHFGALCQPIIEQVPQLGPAEAIEFQAHADSITRLNIHQIITDSEAHRARGRLVKKIANAI